MKIPILSNPGALAPTRSHLREHDKASCLRAALAATLLLCLALAGRAVAEPQQADVDSSEETSIAESAEASELEEDSYMDVAETSDEMSPDDASDITAATDAQLPEAEEEELSEGKQLQQGLKRALIGLLLPAAERKIRDAAGIDDDPSVQVAEAHQESDDAP
jgi:hypothetical protein